MSKSKTAPITIGTRRKGGKRGRNCGTGVYKLLHSRWRTYAVLIAHQKARRIKNMETRFCFECETQFQSRGVYLRHNRKNHLTSN